MRHRNVPAFLRNADAALRWAKKHIDGIKEAIQELNSEIPGSGDDRYGGRAKAYSDFARESYAAGQVELYRAVRVPVIDGDPKIVWSKLGKSWSRYQSGTGVYGDNPHKGVPTEIVILSGIVKPEDVNWEFGFDMFMYYGEDVWDVSMLDDSQVLVTHIDEEPLPEAILGNTGGGDVYWSP